MTTDELIQLFIPIIQTGLTTAGFTTTAILQAYQPTKVGVVEGSALYFYKTGDKRYGFMSNQSVWDVVHSQMVLTETQYYETTFNIMSWNGAVNFIENVTSDIINIAAYSLQNQNAVTTFQNAGVGIYRVTDIKNITIFDDRDRYNFVPSFDFTLSHTTTITSVIPKVSDFTPGIYGV